MINPNYLTGKLSLSNDGVIGVCLNIKKKLKIEVDLHYFLSLTTRIHN